MYNVSNLVKNELENNELEKKITNDHDHDKYVTTQQFDKLTSEHFSARLTEVNLASKNDTANFVKKTGLYDKLKNLNKTVTSNKTTYMFVENKLNEISENAKAISRRRLTKDFRKIFSYHNGSKLFTIYTSSKYITYLSGTTEMNSLKSNGMSEEHIKNIIKSDSNFTPTIF